MRTIAAAISGIAFSLVALKFFPVPYIWISLCWLLLLIFWGLKTTTSVSRAICFNLGIVVLAFTVVEFHSFRHQPVKVRYGQRLHFSNDDLGYAPAKGVAVTARKRIRERLVFDVTYTIGDDGLRITSPPPHRPGRDCVLFFGGSFTFGDGVEDHESMPYVFERRTNYDARNFAFTGYGPHQMLAAIERGIVDKNVADCAPKAAIYQAINSHAERAAGKAFWGTHGPKYALLPDGTVVFAGHFDDDDDDNDLWVRITSQLNKSFAYAEYIARRSWIREADWDLLAGIVKTAESALNRAYPGLTFHMIVWGRGSNPADYDHKLIVERLTRNNVDVHLVRDILPDYEGNPAAWSIPGDGHPNAAANDHVACYIAQKILRIASDCDARPPTRREGLRGGSPPP